MIDLNKAKARMKQLQKQRKDYDSISYNLHQGDNVVRFILKENYDWPFTYARMYYNIQKQFFLSPEYESPDHEPQKDPILQELNLLMKSGNPDDAKFAKSQFPSKRVFGLGVVRSQEDKGAVWISFPQTVEKQIMEYLFNSEYIEMQKELFEKVGLEHPGEILDITNTTLGVDFLIHKNMKTLNGFPEYTVKPVKLTNPFSPLATSPDKVKEIFEGIPDFTEAYKHMTTDEVREAWDNFLAGGVSKEDEKKADELSKEIEQEKIDINKVLSKFQKIQQKNSSK